MTDANAFSAEDIGAMRRQGDLRDFLRTRQLPTRTPDRTAPPADGQDRPGHIPGAWPVSTAGGNSGGGRVCACPSCKALAKDQPPLEDLLRLTDQSIDPEIA
jgi:hypothetical protein